MNSSELHYVGITLTLIILLVSWLSGEKMYWEDWQPQLTNWSISFRLKDDDAFSEINLYSDSLWKYSGFSLYEAAVMSWYPYDSIPLSIMSKRAYRFPSFYNRPSHFKVHLHSYPHTRPWPSDPYKLPLYFTHTRYTRLSCRLLCFPLISSVPYFAFICLIPHCNLLNTFWPSQLVEFCS